jgi:streptogrisin C
MKQLLMRWLFVALASVSGTARAADPLVQTSGQALLQDAVAIAPRLGITTDEALARIKALAATVSTTDRIRTQYRDRLAGLFVEHGPTMRIVVLLTGVTAPAGFTVDADGLAVPVEFRPGAVATRDQVLAAIDAHRAAISSAVRGVRGIGHDPRSGSLLLIVRPSPLLPPVAEIERQVTQIAGVPARVRLLSASIENLAAIGGGRVEGVVDGRRYYCTTGFVVRDDTQTGITTAAHCADDMTYRGPDGEERRLTLLGSWGAAYRDIQIHGGGGPATPLMFADRDRTVVRSVTGWRTRPQTRSGDIVCLRGESSGYACSLVDLPDFAPPGELCGGLCSASWVTVAGPACRHGDSGAPVFVGTTALGTLKAGAFLPGGGCAFYYYMSTDYLPDGWRIVTGPAPPEIAVATKPERSVRASRHPRGQPSAKRSPQRRRPA